MAHERKCNICGREYRYCPRCDEFKDMPTWMLEFDDENCRKIYYDIVNPFAFKHISKAEASERLKSCDLSHRESFRADVKAILDQILAVEAKKDVESKEKEKPVEKKRQFFKNIKED